MYKKLILFYLQEEIMLKLSSILKNHNCAMPVIWICAFAIIICLVTGCSSAPKNIAVPLMTSESEDFITSPKSTTTNQPVEIRTSLNDKRPGWTNKPSFEETNSIYFTGGFLKGGDYSVTLRCANAEALKSMVQAINQFVRAEFSMFTHGSNDIESGIDRYIQDGIATFTRNLHIQGIRQAESYYEEMYDPVSRNTFFNAWVKLEISKTNYLKAKYSALKKLRDDFHGAGEIEAKEKAQRLLDDLKGQVSEAI